MLVEGQFGQMTRYPLDLKVQRRMCAAKSRPSTDKLYRAQLSLSDPVPTLGTAQVSIVVRVIELWGCRFKPAELLYRGGCWKAPATGHHLFSGTTFFMHTKASQSLEMAV